ncbi:MAG: FAD/NAD(P)-binding protein, partial [Steroidobacteraceae bacterium]
HDHAGSVSAFKILSGTALETRFAQAADSLVDPIDSRHWHTGEVGLDAGEVIHAVVNDCPRKELLVSIHVYSPPIPELRRFTMRSGGRAPADAFQRRRAPSAPTVGIVGGGFSGAMVAVQLVRRAAQSGTPVQVVMIDRQTSIAEGAAYRTPDAKHLLNVPASGMSAWPDRPDDFLEWARRRDASVEPHTFLPRRAYGEYLRATFLTAAAQAGIQTSIEIRREEADSIERRGERGWRVHCGGSQAIEADIVVLATGHRPPVDPLKQRWSGSRARYIEDPWSSLALSAVEKDESVCLLGTGLTAIDVLQSLGGSARSAPITAVSRRGLVPAAHAPIPLPPIDPRGWLEPLLRSASGVTTRAITRGLRRAVLAAESAGQSWRQVMDGLRPDISQIWRSLAPHERERFLRHARAFWEVARHRMAPTVAEEVRTATTAGIFSTAAARILGARGTSDGVTLTMRRRAQSAPESLRFDWIVNCTGPGSGFEFGLPPVAADLIEAGYLAQDALGLGVRSTPNGKALAAGRVIEDLVVIGSLRKADEWESTAVPELRLQAALAADAIIHQIIHLKDGVAASTSADAAE